MDGLVVGYESISRGGLVCVLVPLSDEKNRDMARLLADQIAAFLNEKYGHL
jgi:hypothetical protein